MLSDQQLSKTAKASKRRAELVSLQAIDFTALEATVKKWMLVPDAGVLRLLWAVYISNTFNRRPVWLMIIGPSGGGKTELLQGMIELPLCYSVSLLTANTFLSGFPSSRDASLLPKLTGKVMIVKDWTIILAMKTDTRHEVMGQMRGIWDGRLEKEYGNGKSVVWEGKVSIIAASTQVVDLSQQEYAALGQRFISYRPVMPNRKEVAWRSLANDTEQDTMRSEIANAMYSFEKGLDPAIKVPPLPQEVQEELINLADFSTMARSSVIRDTGIKHDVKFVPDAEMPTRIVQQLNSIASGLAVLRNGEHHPDDMRIIYKCALDSIPQTNRMVMLKLARQDSQTTAGIATALGYPTEPIHVYLENLALLGIAHRQKGSSADKWTLLPEFVEILKKYEHVEAALNTNVEDEERLLQEAEEARLAEQSIEVNELF